MKACNGPKSRWTKKDLWKQLRKNLTINSKHMWVTRIVAAMLAFMSTMLLWYGAWTLIAAIPSLQSPAVALLAGVLAAFLATVVTSSEWLSHHHRNAKKKQCQTTDE